jgi:Aerotolerance regulator N-terminal
MGITFLQPWAWLLATAVALPIAVHLLARDRSRRVLFPTLRFLDRTKLSAVSRQTLQDWPLLAVRLALVLAAVTALAAPVFVTPTREAEWAGRVARAIVLDDRTASPEDELRSAAVGATFARTDLGDAVGDAARWLGVQRPVAREIVVSRRSGEVRSAPATSWTCRRTSTSGWCEAPSPRRCASAKCQGCSCATKGWCG